MRITGKDTGGSGSGLLWSTVAHVIRLRILTESIHTQTERKGNFHTKLVLGNSNCESNITADLMRRNSDSSVFSL
jgi:hypothetical protein